MIIRISTTITDMPHFIKDQFLIAKAKWYIYTSVKYVNFGSDAMAPWNHCLQNGGHVDSVSDEALRVGFVKQTTICIRT